MRVIALVDGPGVVRRNLEHLEHRVLGSSVRGPPAQAPDRPAAHSLTCRAVSDIAQRNAMISLSGFASF